MRQWYEPQLERLYEAAQARRGDLDQLERLAQQHRTRESFVTELTLDPPQATGDLSGDPLLDEDYLVLSTVHSAKGQEWESVHVLNVTDGSFPSEFATGRAELLEEERRLLYVAMTRARSELRLVAPVRFYVDAAAGPRRPLRARRPQPLPQRQRHGEVPACDSRRDPGGIRRTADSRRPAHRCREPFAGHVVKQAARMGRLVRSYPRRTLPYPSASRQKAAAVKPQPSPELAGACGTGPSGLSPARHYQRR